MAAAGVTGCGSETRREVGLVVGLVGVSGTLLVVAGGGEAVASKIGFELDVDESCSMG